MNKESLFISNIGNNHYVTLSLPMNRCLSALLDKKRFILEKGYQTCYVEGFVSDTIADIIKKS